MQISKKKKLLDLIKRDDCYFEADFDLAKPSSEDDIEFLIWLHQRLVHVHNESPWTDYMWGLRAIICRLSIIKEAYQCQTK